MNFVFASISETILITHKTIFFEIYSLHVGSYNHFSLHLLFIGWSYYITFICQTSKMAIITNCMIRLVYEYHSNPAKLKKTSFKCYHLRLMYCRCQCCLLNRYGSKYSDSERVHCYCTSRNETQPI